MRFTFPIGMIGLILVFLMGSCASSLHLDFDSSRVEKDVYSVLTNDSIGLWVKAPGDIDFKTEKGSAEKYLKKDWELNRPENIILVGRSTVEPLYAFIVTLDSPSRIDHGNYSGIRIHTFEREIDGHRVNLVAHGEQPNLKPDDFLFILDNMKFN